MVFLPRFLHKAPVPNPQAPSRRRGVLLALALAPLSPLPQDPEPLHPCKSLDLDNSGTMTSTLDNFLDELDRYLCHERSLEIIRDNPGFVDFSATASANGGVDITTDSCRIHAPNHLSVHHPLSEMLLFAYVLPDGRFMCHQSIAPKIIFDTTQPSRIVYVAGWIPADTKTESPNAERTPIFTRQMLNVFGSTVLMSAPYGCAMAADEGCCGVSDESTFKIGRAVSDETDYQQQGMLAGGSHVARLQVPMALELPCVTAVDMEKNISSAIPATPQSGDYGFFQHSANAEGNRMRKNIFTISTLTEGNPHRDSGSTSSDMPVVILDSQAQASCTGNFDVLSNLEISSKNIVLVAANGEIMETYISGSVRSRRFQLDDIHFCPEVGDNRIIISGSVLDDLGYHYGFGSSKCYVKDPRTERIVGEGRLIGGDYIMDYLYLEIPRDTTPEAEQPALVAPELEQPALVAPEPEQPSLVSSVWNTLCSAMGRLGLNPQGH